MPQQNSQATRPIPTACPADCPDACAILADRQDGTLRLRPNPAMPLTGFLCGKALDIPRSDTTLQEAAGGAATADSPPSPAAERNAGNGPRRR